MPPLSGRTNVLFVSRRCTARSVLAAACLQHLDARFRCFAAGTPGQVGDEVHALALEALRRAHIPPIVASPCSFDAFVRMGAPRLHLVITLDAGAAANLPAWPGQPEQALWTYTDLLEEGGPAPDPQRFVTTLLSLRRRLELLVEISRRQAARADFCSDLREMAYMP